MPKPIIEGYEFCSTYDEPTNGWRMQYHEPNGTVRSCPIVNLEGKQVTRPPIGWEVVEAAARVIGRDLSQEEQAVLLTIEQFS